MQPNWFRLVKTGNITGVLSYIAQRPPALLLNIKAYMLMICSMKHTLALLCTATSLLLAAPAFAESCYADYKAKQDNPLRLHDGVIQIVGPCDTEAAKSQTSSRLQAEGWTLLSILSTFGADGLAERKQSAGPYYLRF